jgi:hypothetical protein
VNPEEARAVLAEVHRRSLPSLHDQLIDEKFPQQRAFVLDRSQFVVATCTRRAGKSHGLALRLYRAALRIPNSLSIYLGLTRLSSENIMWPVLKELNTKYGIGAVLTDSDLTVTLPEPNNSVIRLMGADQKNFIERLRGPKYAEAQIDEAQSFRSHLGMLIDDILTPALGDYRGSLVLTGTPGPIPAGDFYDASEGETGHSKHKWKIYENPYFPNPKDFVLKLKKKKKWSDENPTYRREYLGEWVVDRDALVYKFDPKKNFYRKLPEGHDWSRVLSVDFGWNDQTAFAVVTYSQTLREVFVEHVEGHAEMIPSEIAERLQKLRAKYKPVAIVADTGGLGKSIAEEFKKRHKIPIQAADKTQKLTFIRLLNGDFIDSNLWVHESLTELKDQYEKLVKGDDGLEDPTLPNDLCDAVLYAYRRAKHYLGEIPEGKPKPGTPQALEEEADDMEEAEEREFQASKTRKWWEK